LSEKQFPTTTLDWRTLLSESIRSAVGQGHDYFSIGVDLVNEAAYQFYSTLGFEV